MRYLDSVRQAGAAPMWPSFLGWVLCAALTATPMLATAQISSHEGTASRDSAMAKNEAVTEERSDTIEQRITALHQQLKITAAEEFDWKAVAQTMRDNTGAMEKLASDKVAEAKRGFTAVQDLKTYGEFAQAHVDHLKKLTSAFETLYDAMPEIAEEDCRRGFLPFSARGEERGTCRVECPRPDRTTFWEMSL